jgi:hypothetical protein
MSKKIGKRPIPVSFEYEVLRNKVERRRKKLAIVVRVAVDSITA